MAESLRRWVCGIAALAAQIGVVIVAANFGAVPTQAIGLMVLGIIGLTVFAALALIGAVQ